VKMDVANKAFLSLALGVAFAALHLCASGSTQAKYDRKPVAFLTCGEQRCQELRARDLEEADRDLLARAASDVVARSLTERYRGSLFERQRVRTAYVVFDGRVRLPRGPVILRRVSSIEALRGVFAQKKSRKIFYLWPALIGAVSTPEMPECERALLVSIAIGGLNLDALGGSPKRWADEMPSYLVCETATRVIYFEDTSLAL
jgi:hypothetical protein